jgi:succinoglycan biosynthesis transport protein ExoP
MQSQETFHVPRRALDIEDYIDIVRRHKAWILGPTFAGLVISTVVAFLWPDTYVSQAIIRVVPSQVPEKFVPSSVNAEIGQRINTMSQTILSRANLTNIITSLNLYPKQRQSLPMEDVVENMRREIHIGNVMSMNAAQAGRPMISAFSVSFEYPNRYLAQKVVADIVSRFISENQRDLQAQSGATTQFLREQWEAARKELDDIEKKLTAYRQANQGHLPEQLQTNLQQMNALEARLTNLNASMSRVNADKMMLESSLRIAKERLASLQPPPDPATTGVRNERLLQLERDIQNEEMGLASLRQHYRDTYPDVQRVIAHLNLLKKTRDELRKEEESKKPEPVAPRPPNPQFVREVKDLQGNIEMTQAQIQARDLEAEEIKREMAQVNQQLKTYQSRIESVPAGEQVYAEMMRDRDLAKQRYDELDKKKSQSELSNDLYKRQQSETLEVLDPASLPQTPSQPKRPFLIGVGTAMGLAMGIFLAGAREMKDTSLKNLKDVRAYTQLTILGSVPLLENDLVVRRRRRLAWLSWTTACLVGISIMIGSIMYYMQTRT